MGTHIASSIAQLEATPATGIRRSRFSFHFSTARRRRWLLVQLVSMPLAAVEDDRESRPASARKPEEVRPDALVRLIDDYRTDMILRRSL
jgi:hypothetical protein